MAEVTLPREQLTATESHVSPSTFFATMQLRELMFEASGKKNSFVSLARLLKKTNATRGTWAKVSARESEDNNSTLGTYAGVLLNSGVIESEVRDHCTMVRLTEAGRLLRKDPGPPISAGIPIKQYASEMMRCACDHFDMPSPLFALQNASGYKHGGRRSRIVVARVMASVYASGGSSWWLAQQFGISADRVSWHIKDWCVNGSLYAETVI